MCRICVLVQCRVHTRIDLFQNPAVIQACRGTGRYGATVYPERVATGRSVVGTVLVLVSIALFVVGWRLTEQDRFYLFEAARTGGQVVGHEAFEREARKVEERFRLVVSFRMPNGDRIRFRSLADRRTRRRHRGARAAWRCRTPDLPNAATAPVTGMPGAGFASRLRRCAPCA